MFPNQVYYNGAIWEMQYSKYFGMGYRKLTIALKKHPQHIWMHQRQMLSLLNNDKAHVAINPKSSDEIYDTTLYSLWKTIT